MNKHENAPREPKTLRWEQFDLDLALKRAKDPRVRFLLEWLQVEQNLRHVTRIDVLATRVRLSNSRLRHLFAKQTGIPLSHYLKLLQLRKAKEALENSFLEVKEVAAHVGMNDVSHFSRDYKRIYRETPSQTRAQKCVHFKRCA